MHRVPTSASEALQEVLIFPIAVSLCPTASFQELIERTGYPRFAEAISIPSIQEAIGSRSLLIDAWLTYSRQKPENWGWFMDGPYDGLYLVGDRTSSTHAHIKDPAEACARFIKGELEAIFGRKQQ